jgi:acetyl esterase/lipase
MLQYVRDDPKLQLPSGAILISPWVEMVTEVPEHATKADTRKDYLSPRCSKPFIEAFLGDPPITTLDNPLVSPVYADLTGMPPMLVFWGGVELLREQIALFVDKAKAAEVHVATYIDEQMPHAYPMLMDFYPDNAKKALGRLAKWIAELAEGTIVEDGGEELIKGMVEVI